MTDNRDTAGERAANAAQSATEQMRRAGADTTERMTAAGQAISESGSQLGMKLLDQAETNTREAFKAMRAAAQANDVSEVMRIQGEYLREQGGRSMAQAREISELILNFGRTAAGQMTGRG